MMTPTWKGQLRHWLNGRRAKLFQWQREVWENGAHTLLLIGGRSAGKTFACNERLLRDVVRWPRQTVIVLMPSKKQSVVQHLKPLRAALQTAPLPLITRASDSELVLWNGSLIRAVPTSSVSARGFTPQLDADGKPCGLSVVIGEASGVTRACREAVEYSLVAARADRRVLFVVGQPGSEWADELAQEAKQHITGYRLWQPSSYANPYADRSYLDALKDRTEYRREILGQGARPNAFFTEAMLARMVQPIPTGRVPSQQCVLAIGCDPHNPLAQGGDCAGLTLMAHDHSVEPSRVSLLLARSDARLSTKGIVELCTDWRTTFNVSHVVVESTSVGPALAEGLQDAGFTVDLFEPTTMKNRWLFQLRALAEDNRFHIPAALKDAIQEFQSFIVRGWRLDGEPKLGASGKRHDDIVLSVAMALSGVWETRGFSQLTHEDLAVAAGLNSDLPERLSFEPLPSFDSEYGTLQVMQDINWLEAKF